MRLLPLTIGTSIKTNLIIDEKGKIVGYTNDEDNKEDKK